MNGSRALLCLLDAPVDVFLEDLKRQWTAPENPLVEFADVEILSQLFLRFRAQAQHLIAAQLVCEGLRRLAHRVTRRLSLDLNARLEFLLAHIFFRLLKGPTQRMESGVNHQAQRLVDILRQKRIAVVVVSVGAHLSGKLRAVVSPAFAVRGKRRVPATGRGGMIFRRQIQLKMVAWYKFVCDERARLEQGPGL